MRGSHLILTLIPELNYETKCKGNKTKHNRKISEYLIYWDYRNNFPNLKSMGVISKKKENSTSNYIKTMYRR